MIAKNKMSNPAEQQAFKKNIAKKTEVEIARDEIAKEIIILEFRKLNIQQTIMLSKIISCIEIIGKENIDEKAIEKMLTKYNEILALTSSVIIDVDNLMN